jgi:hypothetical protein
MRVPIFLMVAGTVFVAGGHASAQTASPGSEAAWAGEARYWADHKAGNSADYISLFDDNFTGWPCRRPQPEQKSYVKKKILSASQSDFAIDQQHSVVGSGFVITFYRVTERIKLGDGKIETIVENFTHTWIPTHDGWKIAGGMCRPAPTE